jgi:rare lipoprotein A
MNAGRVETIYAPAKPCRHKMTMRQIQMMRARLRRAGAGGLGVLLAACANHTPPMPAPRPASVLPPPAVAPAPATTPTLPPPKPDQIPKLGGGYYLDDGPILAVPYDLDALPEPQPRLEPPHRFANRPYSVLGQSFTPLQPLTPYREEGVGSWYGRKFHGVRTASGEPYDMFQLTAAHPTLPIPSYARVTNLENGKSVVVRINDRGPFHKGRIIDLSYAAAYRLGYHNQGSGRVRVEALIPGRPSDRDDALASLPDALSDDPIARIAREAAAPAEPDALVEGAGQHHWVQLGAFSTQTAAAAFRDKVRDDLAPLGRQPVLESSGRVWRVRIGPYQNHESASAAAQRIASLADLRPVVVR